MKFDNELKNMTKESAIASDLYFDANTASVNDFEKFLNEHETGCFMVTTLDGEDVIVCKFGNIGFCCNVYDAKTKKAIVIDVVKQLVISMVCVKRNTVKEFSNGEVSIFLDEIMVNDWKDMAVRYLNETPDEPINDDTKITGKQYYDAFMDLVKVADEIISGEIAPADEFFKMLPLKSNNTFTKNRKIPMYRSNVTAGNTVDNYVQSCGLALCILTDGMELGYSVYDAKEKTNSKRARLAICYVDSPKKSKTLLNSDKTFNDIVSKESYLKDTDVKAGNIYAEKSGTQYLYLGNVRFANKSAKTAQLYANAANTYVCNTYIRMTKKWLAVYNECDTMLEFCTKYAMGTTSEASVSERENPRKFVKVVADKFADYNKNLSGREMLVSDDTRFAFMDFE